MTYEIIPFPRSRGLAVAALQEAAKRHIVHIILEADVTRPRRILKGTSGADGRPFSFTAFVIASYARAIHKHPLLQAYRIFHNKLIIFNDVDVSTYIEHRSGGMVIPTVIRNAHTRSVREISDEMRAAARADQHKWGPLERGYDIISRLPRFIQVLVFRGLTLNPHWVRKFFGTTQLSSFGMLGEHMGWALGLLYAHTLGAWVGGIEEKSKAFEGSVALRECLHLSISIDHDILDAEPAAQFSGTFIGLLESGAALEMEAA
jgi:pyruvate/2-oxoglutarate dehydrogenase complex dihydrolipoamide acyltransferase (E2) component